MIRTTGVLAALALTLLFGACTGSEQVNLDATFDLWRTAEADCHGPKVACRVSYEVEIANDGPEGFYQFQCDVKALDDAGHGVLRSSVVVGGSGGVPSGAGHSALHANGTLPLGKTLWPGARGSITTLTGECAAFRLVGEPVD